MNFVVPSEVNNISSGYYNEEEIGEDGDEREHNKPIIINEISRDRYHKSEIVDEALSLEDMEKDMIKKRLKSLRARERCCR